MFYSIIHLLKTNKIFKNNLATIAQKNQINKYPTLKLYRHGLPIKKEFRGARTVEAFISFIKEQLVNPLKITKSYSEYSVALMEV